MIYGLFKAIYDLFQGIMNDINDIMNDIGNSHYTSKADGTALLVNSAAYRSTPRLSGCTCCSTCSRCVDLKTQKFSTW